MSKPRYDWWGYVKGMIRRYPNLCNEAADLHSQSVTASYTGMPKCGGDGRGLERTALRELTGIKRREYDAVSGAIIATRYGDTGGERIHLINLVFWKQTHTLQGAAEECHISYRTAQQWHADFIHCVARFFGIED